MHLRKRAGNCSGLPKRLTTVSNTHTMMMSAAPTANESVARFWRRRPSVNEVLSDSDISLSGVRNAIGGKPWASIWAARARAGW
eukprot:5021806-Prymnesium_polylepis.1